MWAIFGEIINFRGLKITWVCVAILFILVQYFYNLNFKIVHFCYFQNTFPFVSTFRETDVIRKKHRKYFVEQGIDENLLPRWELSTKIKTQYLDENFAYNSNICPSLWLYTYSNQWILAYSSNICQALCLYMYNNWWISASSSSICQDLCCLSIFKNVFKSQSPAMKNVCH